MILPVIAILVLLSAGQPAQARRANPLLSGDDVIRKPHSRSAECTFGKQIRELGSTWFADLGPPFGVMYCIKCECVPIQKKRRIVARVQCRNIKNECPTPTCDEPVLLPGRCCKSCPGDPYSPDIVQDIAPILNVEDEERSMKHFAALLSGRTSAVLASSLSLIPSLSSPDSNQMVATARFSFHRKSLYYSVLADGPRPRAIQFVDREGSILEEQVIRGAGSVYQNATGKVCGVWRRMSRDYRRLLREERLLVTLLWDKDVSVTGVVQRYRSLNSELLSGLLVPAPGTDPSLMAGAGGTAIVSASTSSPSIHVAVLFNGVFSPQDTSDVPISIRLETPDRQRVVLDEVVRVSKPGYELNEAVVTAAVSAADLRMLTRGKLVLNVVSKRRPHEMALTGQIHARATCDIFQTTLSLAEADREEIHAANQSHLADTPASGQAWLYVDKDNALSYNVQVAQIRGEDTLLTLVSGRGRRRVELEDLTPSLHLNDGWANGTLGKLSPRELEQLYAGELAVNVATGSAASLIRGRLTAKPVADARDAPEPILLSRPDANTPATLTGMAWLALDQDCNLHYDLTISGLAEPRSLQLYMEQVPLIAEGAPVFRRHLEDFSSSSLEGFVMGLSPAELSRIDAGVSYLEIRDPQVAAPLLRGTFRQVRVPINCLPHYSDNDVPSILHDNHGPGDGQPESLHCFHETRFYEDGAQWTSSQDSCMMCSCHRTRVLCDPVVCPPLPCAFELRQKAAPGQCCPSCSNSSVSRGCNLGGQFHVAGSSWHPYVPPNGFDTCAVCTCNASTLETGCERTQCPRLACAEQEAFRPDPKACCKQCPTPVSTSIPPTIPPDLVGDQAAPKTHDDILAEGGCKYPLGGPYANGHEWHPKISSHGEIKCVKCRCKDGSVKCERIRCSRSACNETRRRSDMLLFPSGAVAGAGGISPEDECCSTQCNKRVRRRHKPRHIQD